MDPEVKAIGELSAALEPLDEPTRHRVIRWAAERYGATLPTGATKTANVPPAPSATQQRPPDDPPTFEALADLFVAASPQTGHEKVLVAGYWFQVAKGQTELTSFELNKELKQLGHAVASISREFDRLMEVKPQLAVQLKKAGTTQQARKKYKITLAGIQKVQAMVAAGRPESDS